MSPGIAFLSLPQPALRNIARKLLRRLDLRRDGLDLRHQLLVRRVADINAVEVFELGEIEARGRAADGVEVEPLDGLLRRENLVVAMAPAEPREIIAHRGRQIAHGAVSLDAERAVPLGKLGAVRPVDQRDMREGGNVPAHGVVDLRLPRGIGEVVVAADDVGDAHVMIVHHHREHIGRRAVASAAAPCRRGLCSPR